MFWWSVRLPVPDVELPDVGVPVIEGDLVRLGGSTLERRDGYWMFVHTGAPLAIGVEHARLGEFLIQRVETAMFEDFGKRLPLPLQVLLPPFLMWTYRHMPGSLPPEQQEELWGFSATYADRYPLHPYRRGMYYHALHDITQELVGNPWVDPSVAGACTGFAASGEGTTDGHLILGRNFDFEVFPLFDQEKVVHLFARDGAIPVLSVSWMAMSGVVTGMNAEGIWISLNAARTEGKNRVGPPISLRLRTILEQARSLDDVRRLVAEQAPLVSDIFLVGDGETGEAIVLERGIDTISERSLTGGKLSAANHMRTEAFADDVEDAELRKYSSTLARGLRMEELVAEAPLSVGRAQAILRDRLAPGGEPLAPGNRNAIDAFIATHSVIADATDRVLWVSEAPHTLGAYRAIDLLAELEQAGIDAAPYRATVPPGARAWEQEPRAAIEGEEPTPAPAPADLPRDHGGQQDPWPRLERARAHQVDGEGYLAAKDWHLAVEMADRIEQLIPGSPTAGWIRAEAFEGSGDVAAASAAWADFLQRFPPYGPKTAKAEAWLSEHAAIPAVARPDAR